MTGSSPLGLLASLLRRSPLALAAAVTMGVLGGVAGAGLIAVINRVQHQGPSAFDGWALAAFAGALTLRALSGLLSRVLLVRMGQDVVRHLRTTLARRLLGASLVSLEAIGAPRVMAMLTNDVAAVALFFANIPTLCVNGAIVAGSLIYVAILSPVLLGLTLAVTAAGVAMYRLLSALATRRFTRARETENALFRHLAALTEAFKELKMDGEKAAFFQRVLLGRTVDEHRRDSIGAYDAYAVADLWGGVLFFLPIGIVLFAGLPWFAASPAAMGAYVLTILFLVAPMSSVVGLLPIVGGALVSLRAIDEVASRLTGNDAGRERGGPLVRRGVWRRLTLEGVSFAYGGADGFTVGPLDFELRPGEIVFVVGGNGGGKSTFVKLLTGLYAPATGRICIDGTPVRDGQWARYRDAFSAVFSDSRLIPDIPVAADADAERRLRRHLQALRLDGVVDVREGRFSRVDLSTGQKKRLAMAAALVEDRPLLVLDEWAAEQDAESRAFFYESLLPSLRERGTAVVAVTHDERFFACADRVVRFEYGRIAGNAPAMAEPLVRSEPAALRSRDRAEA